MTLDYTRELLHQRERYPRLPRTPRYPRLDPMPGDEFMLGYVLVKIRSVLWYWDGPDVVSWWEYGLGLQNYVNWESLWMFRARFRNAEIVHVASIETVKRLYAARVGGIMK